MSRRGFFALALALVLGVSDAALGARKRGGDPAELTNFLLGPGHAQWLVGPIAWIATEKERREFLGLTEDAAAVEFEREFWERRGPTTVIPPSGPRITFDERVEEADSRFAEGARPGHRTDRGTVFVVYGPPESVEYASSPTPGGEPIEIWNYPKKGEPGLDGERPERRYSFRKEGDSTRFFSMAAARRLERQQRRPGRQPPQ